MLDGDRRVRAIDDLTIADGQYRFAVSVDDTTIGYRRYDYDGDREHPASPAITEVARRLPDALAGLPRVAHFAVAAAHFEDHGMLDIVEAFAGQKVLEALAARDELPRE